MKVGDLVRVKERTITIPQIQRLLGHIGIVINIGPFRQRFDIVTIHIRGTAKNFRTVDLEAVSGSGRNSRKKD